MAYKYVYVCVFAIVNKTEKRLIPIPLSLVIPASRIKHPASPATPALRAKVDQWSRRPRSVVSLPRQSPAVARRRRVVRSLRELLIHFLDLLVEHLPGQPIDRHMGQDKSPSQRPGSDKRFDLTKRCGSGQRQAFGFVQSNPFIDCLT